MKTSGWIKVIGILCIVFGISALGNSIFPYLISEVNEMSGEMPESSQGTSNWFIVNIYIGIAVALFYMLAGIIFLLKKPYSIWLMYCALGINIAYVLTPLLIIKLHQSIIFVLPGLFIDIFLLILVYRIRKFYFEAPEEIVKAFGDYSPKPGILKVFTFIGFICLSISFSMLGLWIHASNSGKSQDESVAIFKSYFPDFLQSGYNTSYFTLLLCLLAIIFSSLGLKSVGFLPKLNTIILVLSCLLFLLNVFQLM